MNNKVDEIYYYLMVHGRLRQRWSIIKSNTERKKKQSTINLYPAAAGYLFSLLKMLSLQETHHTSYPNSFSYPGVPSLYRENI